MPKRAESESDAASTPLVSVFVGVYNHAPYVRECLDSILNTKYPNLEVFVVNDASPDHSDEIIRGWVAEHPELDLTYILHSENQGLTSSLNEAIKLANGEFFCPIASDDVMLPNGINDRVRYLQEHPEKLAVFADCHVIDTAGRTIFESGIERTSDAEFQKSDLTFDALIPYNIVFHWSVPGPVFMCRTETFSVVGLFNEALKVEDWDMYLRIAATGRLGYYNGYVAKYRIHETNWSRAADGKIKASFNPTLLEDYGKTVSSNIRRFRGINALRLYAYKFSLDYLNAKAGLKKGVLFILKALTLGFSYRAYLLVARFYRWWEPYVGS